MERRYEEDDDHGEDVAHREIYIETSDRGRKKSVLGPQDRQEKDINPVKPTARNAIAPEKVTKKMTILKESR